MTRDFHHLLALIVVPSLLGAPLAAQHQHKQQTNAQIAATIGCDPSKVTENDLEQPKIIRAQNGRLDTTMVVDQITHACMPVWDATNNVWKWDNGPSLKTYGSPFASNPNDWNNLEWTLPGPTFLVRKTALKDVTQPPGPSNPVVEQGSRVSILLRNQLPNNPYPYDQCRPSTVTQPASAGPSQTCPNPPCTYTEVTPECFHGDSVTNLHFHGTHVSPQPHQDFVLLNLFSSNQTSPAPPTPDTFNQVGSYQFDLDPLPWNQAPGTHWYHPHKHGSTSLQVANGMSGALLILGEFDDWLYQLYKVDPDNNASLQTFEKVLIVQQLQEDLNFYNPSAAPAKPVVNGQANPVVHMKPGEIQRWRVVGGTTHASGSLNVQIAGGFQLRQIAQDGVQFAWQNYDRQPYLTPGVASFNVTAGSRMDFLVQAPSTPGTFGATFRLIVPDLPKAVSDFINDGPPAPAPPAGKGKGKSKTAAAPAATPPPLFTVIVDPVTPVSMQMPVTQGTDLACAGTSPPANCWPPLPYFLNDLAAPSAQPRSVQFSMKDPETKVCTKNGEQQNGFWIDGTQYDGGCANIQMTRGTTEDWQIWNDSPLPHPFHIHINPFQVINDPATPAIAQNGPPYVWRDTNPLPVGAKNNPDDGCRVNTALQIRQAFLDYTGAYVIHCHFLGHEDRGMMLNVETLCEPGLPSQLFGRPMAGLPDSCAPGMTSPANPPGCKATTN